MVASRREGAATKNDDRSQRRVRWSGNGDGTFYPAVRLYSVRVHYHTHCGDEMCTKPYGKDYARYGDVVLREHTHTLPKPKPEPKAEKESKKGKGKRK